MESAQECIELISYSDTKLPYCISSCDFRTRLRWRNCLSRPCLFHTESQSASLPADRILEFLDLNSILGCGSPFPFPSSTGSCRREIGMSSSRLIEQSTLPLEKLPTAHRSTLPVNQQTTLTNSPNTQRESRIGEDKRDDCDCDCV